MSDYFSSNRSFDNSNNYVGVNLQTRAYPVAAADHESATYTDDRHYGNFAVDSQSRLINQNNQKSLTWTISLIDDQDSISKQFLKMKNEQIAVTEKFGPAILSVPENIKTQADELFKPSKNNPNEIFELVNDKVSWILPSSYQQYLKSIPQNVMDKKERHVLYPWTQWNTSTRTQQNRPSSDSIVASSDRSFSMSLSSSSSSPYAHGGLSNSNISSIYNTSNDNSFGYCGGGDAAGLMALDTPPASNANGKSANSYWTSSPTRFKFAVNNGRGDGHQRLQSQQVVRSPSDSGRSVSSTDMFDDRSPPPPMTVGAIGAPPNACWPSRLYYCVNADNNTINKLVEHYCTFCYKNHEPPEVYGTHLVRDATRTTCPKLRALKCKHCNGTGDNAHTIKYCPFLYSNYTC